jgi:glycyl-tRNA synthetase beta chain
VGFFAIGEKPTGSGDPYALRRAALGVIRIIRENGLRVHLRALLAATRPGDAGEETAATLQAVFEFIRERLVVQLRADGARYDVLNAVFGAQGLDQAHDDDLVALLARTDAVSGLLQTADGANLLTAYRRAANILRIEERKDGPFAEAPVADLTCEAAEIALHQALDACRVVGGLLDAEAYGEAMTVMAGLRAPLDLFFEKVTVNASDPDLRRNRLRLLNQVRSIMDRIADFSRIEG